MKTQTSIAWNARAETLRAPLTTALANRLLPLLLLLAPYGVLKAQDFLFTGNNGAITITGYTGPGGAVAIPELINGLPVTGIRDAAFLGVSSLTSVTIPDSVTSIGGMVFYDCPSLTNVTIGIGVTQIGSQAFSYCMSLSGIMVDPGNRVYSSVAGVLFDQNQTTLIECPGGLAGNYSIPATVTSIGDYAFDQCIHLTGVTIPATVTTIGGYAFDQCIGLTNVTIPAPVTSVGAYAFGSCTGLTSVSIADTVTNLAPWAFSSCSGLTNVTIPDGVLNISTGLFSYCSGLASVTIPERVTNLGFCAFLFCSNLTTVIIPDSTATIEWTAFEGCSSLTNIIIGSGVGTIKRQAFAHLTRLRGAYFKGNAPVADPTTFDNDTEATVYHLAGKTGWGSTFCGRPTALWTAGLVPVTVSGNGTLSPDLLGKPLQPGRRYTVTAHADPGYVFAGWTGSIVSRNPRLTFTEQADTAFEAHFVPNPFGPAAGTYSGLFSAGGGANPPESGCFTALIGRSGVMSGKLNLSGASYGLSGAFLGDGTYSNSIPQGRAAPLIVQLQVDLKGGNKLFGTLRGSAWSAVVGANRLTYDSRTNPAPQAGQYTLVVAGAEGVATLPDGDGYGTATVGRDGIVRFTGWLADGAPISQSVPLSAAGRWPLYAGLYSGKGYVLGWMTFNDATSLGGELTWCKPSAKANLYPLGFTWIAEANGTRYSAPSRGTNLLGATNSSLTLVLEQGGLAESITNRFTLNARNRVENPSLTNALALTFAPSTGRFSGRQDVPGSRQSVSFNGIIVQGQTNGAGYFRGTDQSGRVLLQSR